MSAKPCLNCNKPVLQTEGRKEKKFCSPKCRQEKWQKDQQALRAHIKQFGLAQFQGTSQVTPSAKDVIIDTPAASFATYEKEILDSTWSGDLEIAIRKMEVDPILGAGNKAKLRVLGENHRLGFTN